MQVKEDPSGSGLQSLLAGSNVKTLPTAAALILMSLKVEASFDEVLTTTLSPDATFSVIWRSTKQIFLFGKRKWNPPRHFG